MSLICKVNSQYVRLQKLERISKYICEKKETVQLYILATWRKDAEETYATYEQEHVVIEASFHASLVTNDYFEADFHNTFHEQYHSIMFEVSNLEKQ